MQILKLWYYNTRIWYYKTKWKIKFVIRLYKQADKMAKELEYKFLYGDPEAKPPKGLFDIKSTPYTKDKDE